MLTNLRVLVVEAEFLVALEIQRVLEQANAAGTAFARSIAEAAGLEARFSEFDLAIIEMPAGDAAAITLASHLADSGVAVVGMIGEAAAIRRASLPAHIPLVNKPFGDAELLTACATALASVPRPRGAA
ncbi:MAG TPA: hypothetical protein VL418_18540 [Devosiaceae bacterium]|jgi:hypothetical protein|nr:hypothetical protein [Devosiaceae bacterium]